MKNQPGTWLRASPAAAIAGVSRITIWRWIVNGVIPDNALLKRGCQYRIARWWLEKGNPCV